MSKGCEWPRWLRRHTVKGDRIGLYDHPSLGLLYGLHRNWTGPDSFRTLYRCHAIFWFGSGDSPFELRQTRTYWSLDDPARLMVVESEWPAGRRRSDALWLRGVKFVSPCAAPTACPRPAFLTPDWVLTNLHRKVTSAQIGEKIHVDLYRDKETGAPVYGVIDTGLADAGVPYYDAQGRLLHTSRGWTPPHILKLISDADKLKETSFFEKLEYVDRCAA